MDNLTTRMATLEDIMIITHQRRSMFEDMKRDSAEVLDTMVVKYPAWLRKKMEQGEYLGWFALNGEQVVAGAGLWLMEWQPHPRDANNVRGYILNVYTHPDYRKRGLARGLMQTIIDYCRAQGITTIVLHASQFGAPLYESMGFKRTNEMRLDL